MEISTVCHGFKLLEEKELTDINSTAQIFEHVKTGARVFNMHNSDDNNVFSISFRTPPSDSTGVAHILEHSVLCGSRKFPTKEPFVELLKGSLKNFLNAFTFPDKTMYPVASKNEKDFFNLMDVYMDAVLHPRIYDTPEIFMQEGWHYELENAEDDLTYKGVVYNEMKGAFSSPEGVLFRLMQKTLYPDTTYGVESGGDPENIPDLTYEQFTDFHKSYYHPSNSFIYLYGDIDIEKKLKFLDEEYLCDFERNDVSSEIAVQEPFAEIVEYNDSYAILDDEDEDDKTFLALNFVAGRSDNPETALGLLILEYLLLESSGSPFKKALLGSGIGKDCYGYYETDLLQPIFSIVMKNANVADKEKFKQLVYSELQKLVDTGIDPKLIEASINKKEFYLREAEGDGYPKGLFYNITAMTSWLYDSDPTVHFDYTELIGSLRDKAKNGYFEQLIEEYLLNNTHGSYIVLAPEKGLENKKSAELRDKLAEYKKSLTDEEIQQIIADTERLHVMQSEPDTPEALQSIPVLDIEDINKETEKMPIEEKEGPVTTLHHSVFTNGIVYLRVLFDSTTVPQDKLTELSLYDAMLASLDTENYTYMELSNEINTHLGSLSFSYSNYVESGDSSVYYPKFVAYSKCLVPKVDSMISLMSEIINGSKFTDKQRIKEIVQKLRSRIEGNIMSSGHSIAYKRVMTYFSQASMYNEQMSGITFYNYIVDLDDNFDERIDNLISLFEQFGKMIFTRENMILSVTCDDDSYEAVIPKLHDFVRTIPECEYKPHSYEFGTVRKDEGLFIPGQVQYVCKGANFKKLGYDFNGKFAVMQTIARLDYLWNNVRVKGGAYGAMTNFARTGNMFFVSYRDPNLTETLKLYDEISEFFSNLDMDERELTKYIIGTISQLDSPLTPSSKGGRALSSYISHLSYADEQRERQEILETKVDDLRGFGQMLKDLMNDASLCVVGSEEKIKSNSDIFGDVKKIIE